MKNIPLFIAFTFLSFIAFGQTELNGIVVNKQNTPIPFANVYLKGTYDGAVTNQQGEFQFFTQAKDTQTLVVSLLGYNTVEIVKNVTALNHLTIQLKENINSLNSVVISAGTFSAGDKSKTTTLKPLDIVTTAGALADPIAAFQTMPGTSTVSEDGRLFVRGGRAEETQVFIDGVRVFTPYVTVANNTPTRGRYSPFLFKGMTFSTGGYSAEYGQALSGVLLLNTQDEPDGERTDIGLMSLGVNLGNTQIWDKSSLTVNTSYINLAPYLELFPDSNDWEKPYEVFAGEAIYRRQFKKGLWKLYGAFDTANFDITQNNINNPDGLDFTTNSKNGYLNTSYTHKHSKRWSTFYGLSYTIANTDFSINTDRINNKQQAVHLKAKTNYKLGRFFKLNVGLESFFQDVDERYTENVASFTYGFKNQLSAIYQESNFQFSRSFALQAGVRLAYNDLPQKFQFDKRLSLAYKLGANGQLSLAVGNFHQNPVQDVLKYTQKLKAEQSDHYILNYQLNKNGKIFRAEAYYKQYKDLVKYNTELPQFNSTYTNQGNGYARGLDVFWRDNKGVKNLDYWLSYSYLDSKRNFNNYLTSAQPNFVNKHNASAVTKYWKGSWKSQIGLTYNFASGRTYTDKNSNGFLNAKTRAYNSLNFNWAYLLSPQKILFFSATNLLGQRNISGYNYAETPNSSGVFEREAIRPNADRFFFVGFFWTISKKKTDNQLDQL